MTKRYQVNVLPMMPIPVTVDVTMNAGLFREMLRYLDVHTIAAMRDDLVKACAGGPQIGGVSDDLCLLAKYLQQHMTEVWPLYGMVGMPPYAGHAVPGHEEEPGL